MTDTSAPAIDPTKPTAWFCDFCGKNQFEVAKVFTGPTAAICNECVMLCMEISIKDTSVALECQRVTSLANRERCAAAKAKELVAEQTK